MRGFLVSLAIVVGLLVAGDLVAKNFASDRMAEEIRAILQLEREPDVDVGGFPFLTQVAGRELESVTVSLDDISRRGVTLTSLSVTFHEVRFSLADLLDQNARGLRVGGADGTATLDQADLDAALEAAGSPFTVSFDQGRVSSVPGQVEIEPRVEAATLVLPAPGVGEATLPLPRPIAGVSYGSVEVFPGRLLLRFESGPAALRPPR